MAACSRAGCGAGRQGKRGDGHARLGAEHAVEELLAALAMAFGGEAVAMHLTS